MSRTGHTADIGLRPIFGSCRTSKMISHALAPYFFSEKNPTINQFDKKSLTYLRNDSFQSFLNQRSYNWTVSLFWEKKPHEKKCKMHLEKWKGSATAWTRVLQTNSLGEFYYDKFIIYIIHCPNVHCTMAATMVVFSW